MKTQQVLMILIALFFFLQSCEKNDEIPADPIRLSTDSLVIIQSDIPVDHYTDVTFVNENVGFAISNFGAIIKTTDCGYSWDQLASPVNFFLSEIQFTDNQTGYIIGGDDSGGYLLKTSNAGLKWDTINLLTPYNDRPSGMFFLNSNTGFISGDKLFRRTTDGGQTWTEVMDPVSENINDVSFKNSIEGYAVSDNGVYFKTSDGGITWQLMNSGTNEHLEKIYFAGSESYAKCINNQIIDLSTGDIAFTAPGGAFKFLFLSGTSCIGIGQHYETGFLPYGDIFLTNDCWETFSQKTYSPQSEAMNVTAIAKVKEGKVVIIGSGAINSTVIRLGY